MLLLLRLYHDCVLPHESTCTKLFPHIARAARRDASRESSQIDANGFAILLLVVTLRRGKKKKERRAGRRKRENTWGYLTEEGQRAAIIAILRFLHLCLTSLYRGDLDRAIVILRALDR